jgi:hypothetical protein
VSTPPHKHPPSPPPQPPPPPHRDSTTANKNLAIRAPIESNRIEFLEIRFDLMESNLYKSSIRSNIR